MCFVIRIHYSSFYSSSHKILCGIQALTRKRDLDHNPHIYRGWIWEWLKRGMKTAAWQLCWGVRRVALAVFQCRSSSLSTRRQNDLKHKQPPPTSCLIYLRLLTGHRDWSGSQEPDTPRSAEACLTNVIVSPNKKPSHQAGLSWYIPSIFFLGRIIDPIGDLWHTPVN